MTAPTTPTTPSPPNNNGQFVRVPRELLSRPDIAASAKLIWATIADRVGSNGRAWPGFRKLAKDTGLNPSTVIVAVESLEAAGLLEVDRVKGNPRGQSNTYRIPERLEKPDVPKNQTCGNSDPIRVGNPTSDVWKIRTEPYQLNQTNRTIPTKTCATAVVSAEVEEIYQVYPRKVGRLKAMESIGKALRRIGAKGRTDPAAWLLGRVKVFAASPAGQAGRYTPHPATWFNQERYDDDDREWQRHGQRSDTAGGSAARIVAPVGKYARVAEKVGSVRP